MSSGDLKDNSWKRLGLIAGGGQLPLAIAAAERERGREPFVFRITPDTDELLPFDGAGAGLGEIGKIMRVLKEEGCDAVCFAGNVKRPNFAAVKPDWRGAALLPKVLSAARKGDGAIINVIVSAFEDEGFLVVGAEAAAGSLEAKPGAYSGVTPSPENWADIKKAKALVEALGPFDVGQAAVVRSGFVLAVEAAEGTDAMLQRCADLPESLKGFEPGQEGQRLGVLVKHPKPDQELRVDLPTIGVKTVENVVRAGLAGIAVGAGRALMVDRDEIRRAADAHGIFVYAYRDEEFAGL